MQTIFQEYLEIKRGWVESQKNTKAVVWKKYNLVEKLLLQPVIFSLKSIFSMPITYVPEGYLRILFLCVKDQSLRCF